MAEQLPTATETGLQYAGPCPEFASHGFRDPVTGKTGLFSRYGTSGFGGPKFTWQARRWVRPVPMYLVTWL